MSVKGKVAVSFWKILLRVDLIITKNNIRRNIKDKMTEKERKEEIEVENQESDEGLTLDEKLEILKSGIDHIVDNLNDLRQRIDSIGEIVYNELVKKRVSKKKVSKKVERQDVSNVEAKIDGE